MQSVTLVEKLYVNSSFAIILIRKRELVALLVLVSHDCCVTLSRGAMDLSVVCDCGIS